MKLGDFFPTEYQEDFNESHFKVGAVFKTFATETTPPKEKRFVILGINEGVALVGCLFINSDVNPNVFPTEDLKKHHLSLKKTSDTEYIDHDSFLDCTFIIERELIALKKVLSGDIDAYLGQIDESVMDKAKEIISSTTLIAKKIKKRYGLLPTGDDVTPSS